MEVSILGVSINFDVLNALLEGKHVRTKVELLEKQGKYGKFRVSQLDGQDTEDEKITTIILTYGVEDEEPFLDVISIDVKKHKLSTGYIQEIGS